METLQEVLWVKQCVFLQRNLHVFPCRMRKNALYDETNCEVCTWRLHQRQSVLLSQHSVTTLEMARLKHPLEQTKKKKHVQRNNLLSATKQSSANITKTTRKVRMGTKALREIKKQQLRTDFLIPRAAFVRVTRDILNDVSITARRVNPDALVALRSATESFLIDLFVKSQEASIFRGRVGVFKKDMRLALHMSEPQLFKDVCERYISKKTEAKGTRDHPFNLVMESKY